MTQLQIARANAGHELNVLVCFEGSEKSNFWRERFLALRERQSAAFHLALSGYRLKELLASPIGDEAYEEVINAGAHLRRDYSRYFRRSGLPIPD